MSYLFNRIVSRSVFLASLLSSGTLVASTNDIFNNLPQNRMTPFNFSDQFVYRFLRQVDVDITDSVDINRVKDLISSGEAINSPTFLKSDIFKEQNNFSIIDINSNFISGRRVNPARPSDSDIGSVDYPLHRFIQAGRADIVDVLLDAGADVDYVNDRGETALGLVAIYGKPDIINILLRAGADLDHADDQGQTPFNLAVAWGKEKAIIFVR